MKEIIPGPKLDRIIAEAVGMTWHGTLDHQTSAWWNRDSKRCRGTLPSFSADLNDAFMAANEVGLFTPQENDRGSGPWVSLHRGPLGWFVKSDETCIGCGRGDSPALAICAAILKLKETGKR